MTLNLAKTSLPPLGSGLVSARVFQDRANPHLGEIVLFGGAPGGRYATPTFRLTFNYAANSERVGRVREPRTGLS